MESTNIFLAGLWTFVIIALLGGIFGKLDGLAILMFFIVALIVSLGIVMMKPRTQV